ncbi:MAG: HAD family phosphatase [Victivallaceae bacterium]|nr:HAD family phosphatase [Victivallaceae bacterium]
MEEVISLFIFDLDGTALGGHVPYKQFPTEFAELLDYLDAHGIRWGTATTWAVDEQLKLIRSSGVKSNPVLLTGSTGRTAFSVVGDEMFPISEYINEVAELDCNLKRKYGKTIQDIINKLKSDNLLENISYNHFGHHVISFKAADGREKELWQILQPLIDEGIYYSFTPGNLACNSLLPEYMNKGRAVRLIQKIAGVSPSETLIAGDETNDLHMFDPKLAKYMACPANAHDEIKEIVRSNNGIVAAKNYAFGIIEAVNKLLKG